MVGGAGDVAGGLVERFAVASEPLRRARVEQPPAGLAEVPGDFVDIGQQLGPRPSGEGTRRRFSAAALVGRPSANQAAKPPSRTATASCPSQRSSHQSRLAKIPESWS